MKKAWSQLLGQWSFGVLSLVPITLWVAWYLKVDLWYDEVISLQYFSLTTWEETVTNYLVPNNHILFNLWMQCWTRCLGIRSMHDVIEDIALLRMGQVFWLMLSLVVFVKIIRQFVCEKHAVLGLLLLGTTIPFVNYSLQLRGYNLSAFLVILLWYQILNYQQKRKSLHVVLIVFCSAALLYTTPANLYSLTGLVLGAGVLGYSLDKKYIITVWGSIGLGALIALLCYYPVWEQVVDNRYVNQRPNDTFYALKQLFSVHYAFLSKRYLYLPLIVLGGYLLWKNKKAEQLQLGMALMVVMIVPFVVALVHQRVPFQRVFAPLAPMFCLFVVLMLLETVHYYKRHAYALLNVLALYGLLTFIHQVHVNNQFVANALERENVMKQQLYCNYYLSTIFTPKTSIQQLAEQYQKGETIVLYGQLDEPAITAYLNYYQLPYTIVETLKDLEQKLTTKSYILTSYKNKTIQELEQQKDKQLNIKLLNPTFSFVTILQITFL